MSEHIIGAMPDSAREALLEEARAQARRWYPSKEDRLERDAYRIGYLDGRTAQFPLVAKPSNSKGIEAGDNMQYSDTKIEPKTCARCTGKGKITAGKYAGQRCPRCDGSGLNYPLRRDKLQEAFRDGELPEQAHAPMTQWCTTCRPRGVLRDCRHGLRLHDRCRECGRNTCTKCGGKTTITADA